MNTPNKRWDPRTALARLSLIPLLLLALVCGGCSSDAAFTDADKQQTPIEQTAVTPDSPATPETDDADEDSSAVQTPTAPLASQATDPLATPSSTSGFTEEEIAYARENLGYESYSALDSLGRCGVATAVVGPETMPPDGEERGSIGMIKPSGWHTVKYDSVDGKYLYNRCHLIGWQLTAENANTRNLVTGTRWMNTEEMLPVENQVADYVNATGNHVLYRATPDFQSAELVCRGVRLQALSIEDGGAGVNLDVWCPNEQPGIQIDYATGESSLASDAAEPQQTTPQASNTAELTYVVNENSKKFHLPTCSSVKSMADHNRRDFTGTRDELISEGYSPCKRCNP